MSRALESWETLAWKALVSFTCKITFGPGNTKTRLRSLWSGSCYPLPWGQGIHMSHIPSRLRIKELPLLLSPVHVRDLGVHPPASPACELLRRARKRKRLIKDSIVATPRLQHQKRCGNRLSLPWVFSTSLGGTKRTWQLDFLVFPEQFT